MHMTGTLQKVIDARCITIAAVSYEGEWGESVEDLNAHISLHEKRT
jgi:L-glutamine-phosphate cytidylyltransferase